MINDSKSQPIYKYLSPWQISHDETISTHLMGFFTSKVSMTRIILLIHRNLKTTSAIEKTWLISN